MLRLARAVGRFLGYIPVLVPIYWCIFWGAFGLFVTVGWACGFIRLHLTAN